MRHQNPVIDKNLREAQARREGKQKAPKITKGSIAGGLIAAALSKETGMAKYSKLIGTIMGSIVGIAFAYFSSIGLATCALVDGVQACTMFGISQAQVTGALMMLFGSLGTWAAPPNSPIGLGKK